MAMGTPSHEQPGQDHAPPDARTLLMVIPWMTLGGADEFNKNAIDQLRRRGWRVCVAATLDGPHERREEFEAHADAVVVLAEHGDLRARIDHLSRLLDIEKPDAVMISNSELGYYAAPLLRNARPAAAFLDYSHMEENWLDGGYPGYSVGFQDVFDLSLVASDHLRQWMIDRGAADDGARVEVCRVHVDQNRWAPEPGQRRRARMIMGLNGGTGGVAAEDDTPVIIYPVRLCPQKRPHIFCEVMAALRDRGERFRAVIVGDGPDREAVEQTLREKELDSVVHMLGPRCNDEVRRLMHGADILFLPSQWEGIALAIYEAMAMGLAVVGADVGGQRELVTPGCGVLLERPPREADEITAYTEALQPLLQDPQRRRDLGAGARHRIARHFSIEQMGDRLNDLVERAIHLNRTEPRRHMPAGVARQIALRGAEYLRVRSAAEELTRERDDLARRVQLLRDMVGQQACRDAAAELAELESSLAWRLLAAAKQSWPYRALARLRFGPDWQHPQNDPVEDPRHRLGRLKATRTYRTIAAAKSTPPYRWYERRSRAAKAKGPARPLL